MEKLIHRKRVRFMEGHDCLKEYYFAMDNYLHSHNLEEMGVGEDRGGLSNPWRYYRCKTCGNLISFKSLTSGKCDVRFEGSQEIVDWEDLRREYHRLGGEDGRR